MKILAIDPGITTGMATARVTWRDKFITIREPMTYSITELDSLHGFIYSYSPDAIIMEDMPNVPSDEGLTSWQAVWLSVKQGGFEFSSSKRMMIATGRVALVMPGMWKPVMKKQTIFYELWAVTDQHEKDAVALMLYCLRVNHRGKEIEYG